MMESVFLFVDDFNGVGVSIVPIVVAGEGLTVGH